VSLEPPKVDPPVAPSEQIAATPAARHRKPSRWVRLSARIGPQWTFAVLTACWLILLPIEMLVGLYLATVLVGFSVTAQLVRETALLGAALAAGMELEALLTSLLHEGGHMLIGWLVGFRFKSLHAGLVDVSRTRRGLRLTRSAKFGFEVQYRAAGGRRLPLRFALIVAGGPLASLLLAVATWPIVVWYLRVSADMDATIRATGLVLLATFGVMSLIDGVGNAIPFKRKGDTSDGRRILVALRQRQLVGRALALQGLEHLRLCGVRPRRWPAVLVRRALTPEDVTSHTALAWIYAYAWTLDRDEVAAAGAYLDRVLGDAPAAVQLRKVAPLVPLEAAYFLARFRHDPTAAREWQALAGESRYAPFMRPRAEAAILLAEGHPLQALAVAETGLAELARLMPELEKHGSDAETEGEDLRAMANEARRAVAAAADAPRHTS
jgi:hypothetical protein